MPLPSEDWTNLSPDEALRRAADAYQKGNLETAERLVDRVLRTNPDHHDALVLKASLQRQQGQRAAAMETIQSAVRTQPNEPVGLRLYALLLDDLGNWEEAEKVARKVIYLRGDDALAYNALGLALAGRAGMPTPTSGDPSQPDAQSLLERNRLREDAITQLQTATQLDASLEAAYVNLGKLLSDAGRYKPAREALRQALQLKAHDLDAIVNLGVISLRTGDLAGAAAEFNAALQLNAACVPALVNLGTVRYRQGNNSDALELANRALDYEIANAGALVLRGSIRRDLGKLDAAHQDLDMAVQVAPDNAEAHAALGTLQLVEGQAEAARVELSRALALGVSDAANVENNLGLAFKALSHYEEAQRHFERALEEEPRQPEIHYNLAVTLDLAGQREAAVEQFKTYLKLAPGAVDAPEIEERVKELQQR